MGFIKDSFFIKAGREQTYIKCFQTGLWIRCKSKFEVDETHNIQKVYIDSSNLDFNTNKTVQTLTKKVAPFDHPRVVLAQFEYAEMFLKYLIKQLRTNWWKAVHAIIFQLDYEPEGEITDIELRAIRDSLEHCGAKEVYIVKPSVSESRIDELYQSISKKYFFGKKELEPNLQSLLM